MNLNNRIEELCEGIEIDPRIGFGWKDPSVAMRQLAREVAEDCAKMVHDVRDKAAIREKYCGKT